MLSEIITGVTLCHYFRNRNSQSLRKIYTRMLHQLRSTLQRPLLDLLMKTINRNPWTRYPCHVPLQHFGKGAPDSMIPYLQGASSVSVQSVEEIKMWIADCLYSRDIELFGELDYWQHPVEFEKLRKGDCEDFSLWVWRKLIRLGYQAEFVAGWVSNTQNELQPHTWVHYQEEETSYLFDPVLICPSQMIRPLAVRTEAYLPEFSMDEELKSYVYAGYYQRLRQDWT